MGLQPNELNPIEVGHRRMRRRRAAQLLQEFHSLVVSASGELKQG